MKEKVIFDTNIVRNTDINTFLGGRNELEQFLQDVDIVIPETVVQEIKRQKKQKLSTNKNKFLSNPFHKLLAVDEATTNAFDIEGHIESLIFGEAIPFERIDLKSNDVLPLIKELALNKKPPFESSDNTDKGFKDALIYFTVLEYLQEIPNKNVFVCVKDGRLKEAFDKHHNIIVIENYQEFKKQSISQFFDDYFIEKVNVELSVDCTKENIKEYWHNIVDNQIVLLEIDEEEYLLEVDTGEIVSTSNPHKFKESINDLINTGNFETTHTQIEQLTPFLNYLSDDEIIDILNASYSNEQIKRIIEDDDVKEFVGILYDSKAELLESDVAQFLKEILD